MFRTASPRAADTYQRIHVETSMPHQNQPQNQHQIVAFLFDGVLQALVSARGALARGDTAVKCTAIARAVRILEEGLSTGLDLVEGGELANNLSALYDYCIRRLVQANAQNDDALLLEVYTLLEPLAQSWKAIKPNGANPA